MGDEGHKVWQSLDSMHRELAQWDEAIQAFERTLAAKPEDAETRIARGKVYLERNSLEQGLQHLATAVQLDPKSAEAYLFLGLAYGRVGKLPEAVEAFRQAAALDPEDPAASYVLGQNLVKLGKLEEAKQALDDFQRFQHTRLEAEFRSGTIARRLPSAFKVIGGPIEWPQQAPSGPIFMPAVYNGGFALLREGKYEDAITSLKEAAALDALSAEAYATTQELSEALDATRRAISADPKDGTLYYRLGEIYLALNQNAEARRSFAQALTLERNFSQARLQLARFALRDGRVETASNYLITAVEHESTLVEARRLLSMALWADGQYENSIEQLKAALHLSPRDERLRIALAGVLISARKFNDAEQTLQEAILAFPDSGPAHYSLARLYETLGRGQEALSELEEAIEIKPVVGIGELYRRIAGMYSREARLDEAVDAYRKALEHNPNDFVAHKELGDTYLRLSRYDEALAEFVAALVVEPQNPEAYAAVAEVYFRTGKYAEAVEASPKALKFDRDSRARYTLAQALIRLGRTEEGKKELDRFQKMQAAAQALEHRRRELITLEQEASASLEKGEYDRAIALLQEAAEYEPSLGIPYLTVGQGRIAYLGIPYLNLGKALLGAGRHEDGIRALQKALELKADFPDVHGYLAEAYKALGRLEEGEKERAIYVRMKEEQLKLEFRSP